MAPSSPSPRVNQEIFGNKTKQEDLRVYVRCLGNT